MVPQKMLLAAKVFSTVRNVLHVINNDTGEEVEMLFTKVPPRVFQPNKVCWFKTISIENFALSAVIFLVFFIMDQFPQKKLEKNLFWNEILRLCLSFQSGYTFVAEVWKPESLPADAKWKMVLMSTEEPLPKMSRETPLSAFSVKKFQDYYTPNNTNVMCRCVKLCF